MQYKFKWDSDASKYTITKLLGAQALPDSFSLPKYAGSFKEMLHKKKGAGLSPLSKGDIFVIEHAVIMLTHTNIYSSISGW